MMRVSAVFVLPLLIFFVACSQSPAPVSNFGQSPGAGSAGVHNVVTGDTLYSISKRYQIPMRDIAVENRLSAPFKLYDGQRLKLPPPQVYTVRSGDTLYEISRLFGVNQSEIARTNNLRSPYTLQPGQNLRLPSAARVAPKIATVRPSTSSVPHGSSSSAQSASSSSSSTVTPSAKPNETLTAQSTKAKSSTGSSKSLSKSSSKPSSKPSSSTKTASIPKRSSSKFGWPLRGKVVSSFGPKKNGLHNDGINISAPKGTPVRAAENGVVVYAGSALKGSGNLILLRHDGQWMTAYGHMNGLVAKKGDTIKRGQTIGTVGSSGSVSTPQLHFEVRRGTEALNPKNYLDK